MCVWSVECGLGWKGIEREKKRGGEDYDRMWKVKIGDEKICEKGGDLNVLALHRHGWW